MITTVQPRSTRTGSGRDSTARERRTTCDVDPGGTTALLPARRPALGHVVVVEHEDAVRSRRAPCPREGDGARGHVGDEPRLRGGIGRRLGMGARRLQVREEAPHTACGAVAGPSSRQILESGGDRLRRRRGRAGDRSRRAALGAPPPPRRCPRAAPCHAQRVGEHGHVVGPPAPHARRRSRIAAAERRDHAGGVERRDSARAPSSRPGRSPAPSTASNGSRSRASMRSRASSTTGTSSWLSAVVAPCPGKCFATGRAPPASGAADDRRRRGRPRARAPSRTRGCPRSDSSARSSRRARARRARRRRRRARPGPSWPRSARPRPGVAPRPHTAASGSRRSPRTCCPAPHSMSEATKSGPPGRVAGGAEEAARPARPRRRRGRSRRPRAAGPAPGPARLLRRAVARWRGGCRGRGAGSESRHAHGRSGRARARRPQARSGRSSACSPSPGRPVGRDHGRLVGQLGRVALARAAAARPRARARRTARGRAARRARPGSCRSRRRRAASTSCRRSARRPSRSSRR